MSSGFSVDPGVLLAGTLLLVGVIASGLAARLRIPSLLLFLALGMLVVSADRPDDRGGDGQERPSSSTSSRAAA